MEEQFILHALGNVGVPAAICFYTLIHLKHSFDRLSNSLDNFSRTLSYRIDKLEHAVEELKRPPS